MFNKNIFISFFWKYVKVKQVKGVFLLKYMDIINTWWDIFLKFAYKKISMHFLKVAFAIQHDIHDIFHYRTVP
jgi:hypothetical protein